MNEGVLPWSLYIISLYYGLSLAGFLCSLVAQSAALSSGNNLIISITGGRVRTQLETRFIIYHILDVCICHGGHGPLMLTVSWVVMVMICQIHCVGIFLSRQQLELD